MFDKITTVGIDKRDIIVFDNDMCKVASADLFPQGTKYDPDFLYLVLRSVSAGEYWGSNNNADYFPESELVNNVDSFLDAHAFQNHDNKLVAAAMGDVLKATWNDKMKDIDLMIRLDRSVAPSVVRGYEKGFLTDVSMGCKVKHSICSICGNKATTEKQFCDHIKRSSGNRNRIYPDGRKCYEINIGPRFHDISSVLKGADKTAKITGILIMNGKIASVDISDLNMMEKAASMEHTINNGSRVFFTGVSLDQPPAQHATYSSDLEKVAEQEHVMDSIKALLQKPKDAMTKLAEMRKEINGKIVALSTMSHNIKNLSETDSLIDLIRLFHTDYWDENTCDEIADKVKEQAEAVSMPVSEAFVKLIHALELSGIELSPKEVSVISKRLLGEDSKPSLFETAMPKLQNEKLVHLALKAREDAFDCGADVPARTYMFVRKNRMLDPNVVVNNIPEGLGLFIQRAMQQADDSLDFKEIDESDSDNVVRAIVGILRSHMPKRSFKRQFLLPRLKSVIDDKDSPRYKYISHFAYPSVLMSKDASLFNDAMDAYSYAVYQHERGDYVNSDQYDDDLGKFASEINGEGFVEAALSDSAGSFDKEAMEAVTKMRIAALPVTFGYSAMQRARIKSGEKVSPINRWVAESPGSAYAVQLAAPMLIKSTGKAIKGKATRKAMAVNVKTTVSKAIREAKAQGKTLSKRNIRKIVDTKFGKGVTNKFVDMDKVKNLFKKAEDSEYTFIFEKDASDLDNLVDDAIGSFVSRSGFDLFTSPEVIEKLSSSYSDNQIDTMKVAIIKQYEGREDIANKMLWNNNLTEDDVAKYLKCAGDTAYEKLEKYASDFADIALSAGQDMMFNPIKSSAAVMLPGNILDGIIFNKLFNKKTKKVKAQPPLKKPAKGAKEVFDNGR